MKLIHASVERSTSALALRIAAAAIVLAQIAPDGAAQAVLWKQQLGTSVGDSANAAAPDGSGGVYAGGETNGSLGGPNGGSTDAWLARFDAAGNLIWKLQLGATLYDDVFALAADGAGGAYACGTTFNGLGGPHEGGGDAWLARFDGEGHAIWTVQLGTSSEERALAVATDVMGGVFVSGSTTGDLAGINPSAGESDAWLAHYDGEGNQDWLVQLGSTLDDRAQAAASDGAGGVFVGGKTDLDLGGPSLGGMDAWLARYDGAGNPMWIRAIGSSGSDYAFAATADGTGGVFLCGETTGDLGTTNAGFGDAWVARYDAAGGELWMRQFGTNLTDGAYSLAPNGSGGVFLGGTTQGSLAAPNAGSGDIFLASYDGAGNQVLMHQLGTDKADHAWAAAADGAGGVHLAGFSDGSFGGPKQGQSDAIVLRFGECGASSAYCSASGTSIAGCQAAIGSSGSPSVSNPGGFTIASGNVPGGNLGICFFGASGPASIPFGSLGGKICVQPPFFRTGPKPSGGSAGQCNGAYAFTLQDLIGASPIVDPGATLRAEIWARDPGNPDGFLLSNGLELTVCP